METAVRKRIPGGRGLLQAVGRLLHWEGPIFKKIREEAI